MTQIIIKPPDGQPIVGDNIQLVWSGQYDGMGRLIQLDSLTITYEEPDERLLPFHSQTPTAIELRANLWYVSLGVRGGIGWAIETPTAKTKAEAIHMWNEFVRSIK